MVSSPASIFAGRFHDIKRFAFLVDAEENFIFAAAPGGNFAHPEEALAFRHLCAREADEIGQLDAGFSAARQIEADAAGR